MVINAILFSEYYKNEFTHIRILILIFSGFFTFVTLIVLEQHRFSQQSKVRVFIEVQHHILSITKDYTLRKMQFMTKYIYDDKKIIQV
jgi:hypothetical protein